MEDNNNKVTGNSWTPGSSSSDSTTAENQNSSGINPPCNNVSENNSAPSPQQVTNQVNVSFGETDYSETFNAEPSMQPKQYSQGCLGAAFSDMKKSGNWLSKSALMALIEYIPILNWVNSGYALRWGRQLIFGKIENMPEKIFGDKVFVTGAMAFLIDFIVGIVSWIISAMFGIIPLFGLLISLCVVFFLNIINIAMNMRAAIYNSLGEGFSISQIWASIKDNFWKAFSIMILPQLICGAIGCAIAFAVILCNGVIFGSDFIMLFKNLAGYAGNLNMLTEGQMLQIVLYVARTFAVLIPGVIIAMYFFNWCNMVGTLLTYRAFGHFVARYAGTWRNEPAFKTVETQENQVQANI